RLWHQLTLQVLDFVQDPCFAQGDGLIKLYENFISEFEHRVNPLSLVEIILHVVRQMTDPTVALTFLEKTREKVKSSDEAVILCKTAIGALKLNIGDLQVTKVSCWLQLGVHCCLCFSQVDLSPWGREGLPCPHPLPSSPELLPGSCRARAPAALGVVIPSPLGSAEPALTAAALPPGAPTALGGAHRGCAAAGPCGELQGCVGSCRAVWGAAGLSSQAGREVVVKLLCSVPLQPDLAANEALLLQKIQLLCLMEMTFTRPANHRQLTFEEIAKSAKVTVNEVELLVMKALSVGLVKGSIDEVDKRVHMTWVQPRVLDLQQIKGMKERLESWCTDVRSMEMLVEHQAHDILT
ncbi:26S proteasome non-ATPase regulatory subunit 13, partial [Dryobates pubescens]